MQHYDIATLASRSVIIPSDQLLPIALDIPGWAAIDTSSDYEALPVEDFTVDAEEALLEMPRHERHRRFKASTKARDITRRSARAAKRASSYIA